MLLLNGISYNANSSQPPTNSISLPAAFASTSLSSHSAVMAWHSPVSFPPPPTKNLLTPVFLLFRLSWIRSFTLVKNVRLRILRFPFPEEASAWSPPWVSSAGLTGTEEASVGSQLGSYIYNFGSCQLIPF